MLSIIIVYTFSYWSLDTGFNFPRIFIYEDRNIKKILLTTLVILLVAFLFYSNINYSEIPFKFNQKDYDDYFYFIEAHRNNMGNLKNNI